MLDPLSFSIPTQHVGRPDAPELPTRRLLTETDTPGVFDLCIDNSSLEKFTICSRKSEYYSVFSRERTYDISAQSFGRLFHLCEELRLRAGLSDATRAAQDELISKHFLDSPCAPTDHRTPERMRHVLRVYNERYACDGWPESVLIHDGKPFVECGFKVPMCTIPVGADLPYPRFTLFGGSDDAPVFCDTIRVFWTGRIDFALTQSGMPWIVDHKTTSSGGSEFVEAFRLASQTLGYCWAFRQMTGITPAGLIVNEILIRPPAKTSKASLPREEFDRIPFFYRPDQMDEWFKSTSHIIADFVACLVRGYFPLSGPKSFKSPCVYCDYHETCRLPAEQRQLDLTLPSYRDVTWNPLSE